MHKYLRTVGFSLYKRETDIQKILDKLQEQYMSVAQVITDPNGEIRWEIRAETASSMGICLVGTIDEEGKFIRTQYYPFLENKEASSKVECLIERHVDGEMYSGLLDDNRVGISLIFRLDNATEYLDRKYRMLPVKTKCVNLSAFSTDGKILLPLNRSAKQKQMSQVNSRMRDSLIEAAKGGDENAIDSLTVEDINLYAIISKRMNQEDIYSIIDSCFMPQGMECDIYSVIGDILNIEKEKNIFTGEEVYNLTVTSSDVSFHVCINATDLTGEPQVGRRFKGTIWMQGKAVFE